MRLSTFNVYVPDYPEAGSTLVYNTFSGGFVSLDASTLAVLKKADVGGELDASERLLVDPDYLDDSVGIVVESKAAEEKAYRSWYENMRSSTKRVEAIVSITFACNLDCTYCCQSDVMNGRMMKADTGVATACWLANRAIEVGAEELVIDFVGGEPLLHPDRVEQIINDINEIVKGRGIKVTFMLITNGMFMTRELVEKWLPLGLVSAQVTLDGDQTTHSMTRRSKKKHEDSFQLIFDNVIACSKLIRITLNGNYQTDTAHGFVPLIKQLVDSGFPSGSYVKFSPALTALGAPSDAASGSCSWSGSNPEIMIALGDELRRANFNPGDPSEVGPCGFHLRHYYAIDWEGNLFKCPGFLGKTEWNVGHVATGLSPRYDGMVNSNPQRSCGKCAHRPECGGGCLASTWIAEGRMENVNCEIGFYDQHGGALVKRKYAIATADSLPESMAEFPRVNIGIPALTGKSRPAALRVITA